MDLWDIDENCVDHGIRTSWMIALDSGCIILILEFEGIIHIFFCICKCFPLLLKYSFLQAMKVENMVKIKEEFDYKSLARRLDIQLDKIIAENERRQKAFEDEIERLSLEAQNRISEAEKNYSNALEVCSSYSLYVIHVSCVFVCKQNHLCLTIVN